MCSPFMGTSEAHLVAKCRAHLVAVWEAFSVAMYKVHLVVICFCSCVHMKAKSCFISILYPAFVLCHQTGRNI